MTKRSHKVKIVAPLAAMGTRVWLDDEEIHGIVNVGFSHPVGEFPQVILTLRPTSVEIDGEAIVTREEV